MPEKRLEMGYLKIAGLDIQHPEIAVPETTRPER
jgi:hypothetical protein